MFLLLIYCFLIACVLLHIFIPSLCYLLKIRSVTIKDDVTMFTSPNPRAPLELYLEDQLPFIFQAFAVVKLDKLRDHRVAEERAPRKPALTTPQHIVINEVEQYHQVSKSHRSIGLGEKNHTRIAILSLWCYLNDEASSTGA
ncbi:hypothetical protein CPB83DRAFT_836288 [Crepidotus variabilis]|uniref:Uncharacterized protein n=1 Tax=Crepidotus variabilis TaxID=179855 RepID=A0A9P6EFD1_9AGAR|nr:hypothetical protein CPB83DRAFT_836288 [Crepidotus variabilis]